MKKSSIAVIGLFVLLYIIPLGARPVISPDEVRYAEIPREMIATGDWVVPRLNGLRYFEKPVMGYWLNAAAMMLFGENAFAIRLPSALAVGISALMVFFLVRRFAGGYLTGIIAATALFTCLEVFALGVFCVLDSSLAMFVTVAMVFFFFAHMAERSGRRTLFLAFFGAFCGFAFLTKGFLAFAVPAVTIVPFLIWEGRVKDLFRDFWIAILAAFLVCLPWSVMIHLRENDFWNYFFWIEHIKRFMSDNAQHSQPFWFFIPVIAVGALPWTVFMPAAISGMRETRLEKPFARFAICWFLFPLLFFSLSQGKLATYILPCFPPLVIVMTVGLQKYLEGNKKLAFISGAFFLSILTGILGIFILITQMTGYWGLGIYSRPETWKWILGAAGLLTMSFLFFLAGKANNVQKKILFCTMAPMLFMFSGHFILPEKINAARSPGTFLMRHAQKVHPGTPLVSDDHLTYDVCWYYKRNNVFLVYSGGEFAYGIRRDDSKHRLLQREEFEGFVKKHTGKKRVTLVTDIKRFEWYKSILGRPAFVYTDGIFVFAQY